MNWTQTGNSNKSLSNLLAVNRDALKKRNKEEFVCKTERSAEDNK